MKVVSEEGIKFASYKTVISFMKNTEQYSEKDIEIFRKFPHGKRQQSSKDYDSMNSLRKMLESAENLDELMKTLE